MTKNSFLKKWFFLWVIIWYSDVFINQRLIAEVHWIINKIQQQQQDIFTIDKDLVQLVQ
jgi:hypothetical protein